MTRDETRTFLHEIKKKWPHKFAKRSKKEHEEILDAWTRELTAYSQSECMDALSRHMHLCPFFPELMDIIKLLPKKNSKTLTYIGQHEREAAQWLKAKRGKLKAQGYHHEREAD